MICQFLFLETDGKEKDQTPRLLCKWSKMPQLPPEGQEKSSQHIKAAGARLSKIFIYHSPYCRCFLVFPSGLKPHHPHQLGAGG